MVEECIREYLSSFVFGDLYRLPITRIPQAQIFIFIESHFNENYCTSTFKVLSMVLN